MLFGVIYVSGSIGDIFFWSLVLGVEGVCGVYFRGFESRFIFRSRRSGIESLRLEIARCF